MADDIRFTAVTQTVTIRTAHFTAAALRKALGLPDDAEITVAVPGGGDWSNAALEISDSTTLDARWTRRETWEETE